MYPGRADMLCPSVIGGFVPILLQKSAIERGAAEAIS
jgi:hypothetical protein